VVIELSAVYAVGDQENNFATMAIPTTKQFS
jgi:hypothetical protein